jgi:hypothetical protein
MSFRDFRSVERTRYLTNRLRRVSSFRTARKLPDLSFGALTSDRLLTILHLQTKPGSVGEKQRV